MPPPSATNNNFASLKIGTNIKEIQEAPTSNSEQSKSIFSAINTNTMFGWFWNMLDWLRSLFWKEEMEVTLVGLQNSGKTTLVNVLANGAFAEDMIPTVGFNMRKVSKGRVTLKIWDIGGQPRFRSMWERYCRGVNAIVFVVDSADQAKLDTARNELRNLLDKPQLQGIPVLVLANKNDLSGALSAEKIIDHLQLDQVTTQEVSCYSISAKNQVNIDITLQWLIKHARTGTVSNVDASMTAPSKTIEGVRTVDSK